VELDYFLVQIYSEVLKIWLESQRRQCDLAASILEVNSFAIEDSIGRCIVC